MSNNHTYPSWWAQNAMNIITHIYHHIDRSNSVTSMNHIFKNPPLHVLPKKRRYPTPAKVQLQSLSGYQSVFFAYKCTGVLLTSIYIVPNDSSHTHLNQHVMLWILLTFFLLLHSPILTYSSCDNVASMNHILKNSPRACSTKKRRYTYNVHCKLTCDT